MQKDEECPSVSESLKPLRKHELLFTSKNEALDFQKDYQKRGYIKKCFNARICLFQKKRVPLFLSIRKIF